MLLLIQWLISYLIVVCGKLFAALLPKDKEKQGNNLDGE